MALDLSMLDEPRTPAPGAVLDLPIDQIEEDPAQPRKTFSQASLDAMATRIRQKGQVEVPVTVHPKRQGKYRLVDGARRYRASLIAGMSTIRSIIEADHRIDPYTQVVVNLQREELKPMEVAQFIEQRRAAGDSLGAVADALGLSARDVTAHLSLLDAPAPIQAAFKAERIRSVHGVYDLCRLHGQHAEAVDAFMAEHADEEITRSMISRLQAVVRRGDDAASADLAAPVANQSAVSTEDGSPASWQSDEAPLLHEDGDFASAMSRLPGHAVPFHDPDIERVAKPSKLNEPNRIRKPLLLADYEGSAVMVRLDRMPTAPGLAFIRYEDGRGEREVELGVLRNWTLTDSKV